MTILGYRIVRTPGRGTLRLGSRVLGKGSTFTQDDLSAKRLHYTHAGSLGNAPTVSDSFAFVIFNQHGDVLDDSQYSACMPERPLPFPQDGIWQFPIEIRSKGYLFLDRTLDSLSVAVGGRVPLTVDHLRVQGFGGTTGDVIYTVSKPPQQGVLERFGAPVSTFTLDQLADGDLQYHHTGSKLMDGFQLLAQNTHSKTLTVAVAVSVHAPLRATGDNVFYARVNSKFNTTLTASCEFPVWSLEDGTTVAPDGGTTSGATEFATWSLYAGSEQFAPNDPRQGSGWNKLPQYRNFVEANYWQGGLPLGVKLTSSGTLSSTTQQPEPLAGVPLWLLPEKPTHFTWVAALADAQTGDSTTRRYHLHVTETGLGPQGQLSERND